MCLAIPGRIVEIAQTQPSEARLARVDFGGVFKEVDLSFVPEAVEGDYVIVHVGLAISLVDKEAAEKTLEYFKEIGDEVS